MTVLWCPAVVCGVLRFSGPPPINDINRCNYNHRTVKIRGGIRYSETRYSDTRYSDTVSRLVSC